MVLHLLGKKSWNVYNGANVERVRHDEAAAQAREEAEEQRMQLEDAVRRTAILRGDAAGPETVSAAPSAGSSGADADAVAAAAAAGGLPRERKRRRLRGEDDSAREIRYAREDAEAGARARQALVKRVEDNAPLVDDAGHLQLIPAPDEKAVRRAEKNAEVAAEQARKRQREEEQYAMRFADAAGVRTGMAPPWYAASRKHTSDGHDGGSDALALAGGPDTDVWGNEDPRRKERERTRISTNDPFAAMQHAQRQLKQSQSDREQWQRARWAELEEPSRLSEKTRRPHESSRHRRRRRRDSDEDSLEGFSLDAPAESRRERSEQDRQRNHRHRHHHHRSRRRSLSRDEQSRRRHRSRRDAE